MKRVKMFYLFLSVLMISCNNGESDSLIENENEEWEFPKEISFTYKDKSYYSECIVIDGERYIVDDEVREVYIDLSTLPNLSTVIRGSITEYYDNYDVVCEKYNLTEDIATKGFDIPSFKPNYIKAEVSLYENTGLAKHMEDFSTTSRLTTKITKQNKLSSLTLKGEYRKETINFEYTKQEVYVTLYEFSYYAGKTTTFIQPHVFDSNWGTNTLHIRNLKDYDFGSDKNWNDRANSLILGIRIVP